MPADVARLVGLLREAEALFDADDWLGRPNVVQAAVDLVQAGVTAPAVVALAGDDNADHREIASDLRRAREQLHLETMTPEEAATARCRWAARAYLGGTITAKAAASIIAGADADTDYSIDVGPITQIADEMFCDPPTADEDELRQAALDFLAREDS